MNICIVRDLYLAAFCDDESSVIGAVRAGNFRSIDDQDAAFFNKNGRRIGRQVGKVKFGAVFEFQTCAVFDRENRGGCGDVSVQAEGRSIKHQ